MKAYDMLQELAWYDRQAITIRDAAKERSTGASKSLARQLHEAEILMDSLHLKMVVVKEGKVIGDERLREKIGFIYGSVMGYKGRPTDAQINGLNALSMDVETISTRLTDFRDKKLPEINAMLVKAGMKEITVISREEFFREP